MKAERDRSCGELLCGGKVHKTNNERFNQMLNSCKHPRRVYSVSLALAEPSVEQADNVLEKRKIIIRDLLAGFDIPESDKQVG